MLRARLLLGDRNALIVEALSGMLEQEFEVIGTATDAPSLLDKTLTLGPDVVILGPNAPKLKSTELDAELRKILPRVRIVVLTMSEDRYCAAYSPKLRANLCPLGASPPTELATIIGAALLEDAPDGELPITAQQKQVLHLLAHGRTMKQIAKELGLTSRTVAFHKYEIMREYNLRSDNDIVMFAIRRRILLLPV